MKPTPSTICGHVQRVSGRPPLVCERDDGHDGRHAVLDDTGAAIAQWPVPWTADDQARATERQAWQKPHVRRAYQTLSQWKAARS
jgi:hypothetical protein